MQIRLIYVNKAVTFFRIIVMTLNVLVINSEMTEF